MSDKEIEISRQLREGQNKYTYFLFSITIASIAFSVQKTTGKPISYVQIPLSISVICWALGLVCGFKYIRLVNSTLFANSMFLKAEKGIMKEIQENPATQPYILEGIKKAMIKNSNLGNCYSNWQYYLFFIGAFFFLIWHILEMCKISVC
ncbi:MAG: hypothetical protein H8E84_00925 [Flavobacteriales bacterium]|nr:hypothetical protein [Flavobacteriales bacterium]